MRALEQILTVRSSAAPACRLLVILGCTALVSLAQPAQLTPSAASAQPVGTSIVWTAASNDARPLLYRFSVARAGTPFRVVRDYWRPNTFTWTPIEEDDYLVRVEIRTTSLIPVGEATQPFSISSRIVAGAPVVTATDHPLIAIYSAPPCAEGIVFVDFSPENGEIPHRTDFKRCVPGRSVNFYVAGMRQSTQYLMRHYVATGAGAVPSADSTFTTGPITRPLPDFSLVQPPMAQTSWTDRVLLHSMLDVTRIPLSVPVATDLYGRVTWYYDRGFESAGQFFAYVSRPLQGGTMLLVSNCCFTLEYGVSEIDLAGHAVRLTPMSRINAQLILMGKKPVRILHHEATRFPNGQTLVFGLVEEPGSPPVMGDVIIALDEDFQVAWTWSAFDHLDTNRSVLDEPCFVAYGALCPGTSPLSRDWMHSNSIAYSPSDGNLIISVRHQDWVIKIDYQDGAGGGDVIWKLGRGGNFQLQSDVPFPWFSHQHDATYVEPNRIAIYDNGNTRCIFQPSPCESRGQVYELDEQNMTAQLIFNRSLGVYSPRHGSAQLLRNGNLSFGSGYLTGLTSNVTEVTAGGSIVGIMRTGALEYRTFRLKSLYEP